MSYKAAGKTVTTWPNSKYQYICIVNLFNTSVWSLLNAETMVIFQLLEFNYLKTKSLHIYLHLLWITIARVSYMSQTVFCMSLSSLFQFSIPTSGKYFNKRAQLDRAPLNSFFFLPVAVFIEVNISRSGNMLL